MKVSVVVTVKNESQSINRLIDSLLGQTKMPEEIIVVDAGSIDETKKIIKRKKSSIIRMIELNGVNRSRGRNEGIKAARHQIIAVTDAGCVARKDWLEKLTRPFNDKLVIAVAGFYRPVVKTTLQAAIAPFLAVMPDQFDPLTYLPSSRSLAFRRGAAWYPENLNYCEDLTFAKHLEKAGRMARAKEAIVDWQIPTTLNRFFTQVKNYAAGDVAARYWPHLKKIITVWGRYGVFLLLPPLFLIYIIWIGLIKKAPLRVQLVADLAVIWGSLSGIISKE